MHFREYLQAKGWHARMPHPHMAHDSGALRSQRSRRRLHITAALIAVATLAASAGVAAIDDPRPLDEQLSTAMDRAGETLHTWHAQLAHGLQVSLRAVADGNDRPALPSTRRATVVADAIATGAAVVQAGAASNGR
ncbi:MAG: hypothetical protein EOP35_11270 [Rubrivivax sp.]|nr:MAG: hypothetical protein EOP35_11270 [Rubrivivax sp.]